MEKPDKGAGLRAPGPAPAATKGEEEALLVAEDVHRSFGGVQAVRGASFSVKKGSLSALIGPNGAGKSTMLDCIAGAIKPDRGTIVFNGQAITGWRSDKVASLSLIRTFQLSREFKQLTVMENLMVTPRGQAGERLFNAYFRRKMVSRQEQELAERAADVLAIYGLYDLRDERAGTLSGGQKRLLELARAVMAEPLLLLLDEPMAGINPALIDEIGGHLRELNDRGMTILMVEHNLGIVDRLCDDVIVMAEGRTLAVGRMADLRDNPQVVSTYLGGQADAGVVG
jgi:ABC-type branched-subunit amino acid transport system ATPase component